jgi:hypothetical protein
MQGPWGLLCASCGQKMDRGVVTVTVAPEEERLPTPWERKYAAYIPKTREGFRVVQRPEFHARSNPRR